MRTTKLIAAMLLLLPLLAWGQQSSEEVETAFLSRTALSLDWKVAKGLHVEAGYEMRTADNFSRVERNQFSAGIQYSPLRWLDIGGGYCFIGHYDSELTIKPRHRAWLDLGGFYRFGAWKLSLRERVQLTCKAYDFNLYQQTPNLVELKSRLKLAYKGFIHLEPYAYVELRNCFNGPSFTADYNASAGRYSHYQFSGYTDAYINRLRCALGLEWKISRHHAIDLRLMTDGCRDKSIDTNAEGTKLKSYTWEPAQNTTLALGYQFAF